MMPWQLEQFLAKTWKPLRTLPELKPPKKENSGQYMWPW